MRPTPGPKLLRALTDGERDSPQPSCLHTTWSSFSPHPSSQTEPHTPLCSTSSLPEHRMSPPTSLKSKGSTGFRRKLEDVEKHVNKKKWEDHLHSYSNPIRTFETLHLCFCDYSPFTRFQPETFTFHLFYKSLLFINKFLVVFKSWIQQVHKINGMPYPYYIEFNIIIVHINKVLNVV